MNIELMWLTTTREFLCGETDCSYRRKCSECLIHEDKELSWEKLSKHAKEIGIILENNKGEEII